MKINWSMYQDNQYVIPDGLYWPEILRKDVSKSGTTLQPIFEAFTNSIEAIRDKQKIDSTHKGEIIIKIFSTETTVPNSFSFSSLSISDNGIGFNDEQFQRFNTFRDNRKNYKNLGSGRIQYVHYFGSTTVKSVFEQGGGFYEREFIISKNQEFIKHNALVKHKSCKKISSSNTETKINFNSILEKSGVYDDLTDKVLKKNLLERYILYFCYNQDDLPKISIQHYIYDKLNGESNITKSDIPNVDKKKEISLEYYKKINFKVEKLNKSEKFYINAFKVDKKYLNENKISLASKGEIIEESPIKLESLASKDSIKGFKYLFLVSSNYIDERDTNTRGVLKIPSKAAFEIENDMFAYNEEIFIEEIQEKVNSSINIMYPEIQKARQKHNEEFTKLKEMFFLDDDTANDIIISINDSETEILKKFYESEAKKQASLDASIKESIDHLDKLDSRNPNYEEELEREISKLVQSIPLQNKKTLTHYVARRKLVLELLDKILGRKLLAQQQDENYDESLIHNMLFQKGSTNTEKSDLWILNEDFIYFKGSSEKQLNKIKINGVMLFKDKFTEEEEKYLTSLGENRKIKRPDILLFPEEGKCIIIEFKAPNVNASDHLTQIDRYANLILNYSEEQFQITTFFGYLLGESIEPRDVLGSVSRYEHSYQFDYIYRPSEKVNGFDGRKDGSIYTEVIKYSTLLKRAKLRNKIFIDKLK